jgi:hypothetical protein
MLFKPPLTELDLQAIQERNRDSPDVITLLWEIKRLRAIVLRADQLQRSIDGLGGGAGMILNALRDELKGEPVINELPKLDF